MRSTIAANDGRSPGGLGLAEHHVVGAALGREHGVVPRVQAAAAGDARRLQPFDRRGERLDAGQMRAVGAASAAISA